MAAPMIRVLLGITILIYFSHGRIIKSKDIPVYRKKVENMFHHAYDNYIRYAYPYDELRPLTCDGHDTWGSYSLTLIDALDTLVIMGNNSEFQRVANLVIEKMNFDQDINVSVFETNIRVVGGLLSAHLMAKRGGLDLEPGWPCSGPLLRMAEDVGRRLLPAFDTPTGMPYGTVNLKHGVPKGETTVTCTAGVGTFVVEFGALSKLTGDPIFEKVAMRAMRKLWELKSVIGLVGNHVDVASGKWTALDSGIGGGVDSYFEYLVKGAIMLESTELLDHYNEYMKSIEEHLKKDDWYMWAHMTKGSVSLPLFTSLDCYLPGIQALIGDIDKGMKTIHNFHQVWKQFGFLPEFYNIVKNEAHLGREGYPLRPELIESAMYLYQATKDPYLLEIGVDMLESIEINTRTSCGYATVKDVNTHMLENRMESFFLAETTKYLYLLFDPDNFIHNSGNHGSLVDTPNGECVINTGSYIFNTEAHPIDTAALYCCSAEKKKDDLDLLYLHDNLDLLDLFGITENSDIDEGVRWTNDRKQNNKMNGIIGQKVKGQETLSFGEHQVILTTQGQKFTVSAESVKLNQNGYKVTVSKKENEEAHSGKSADGQSPDGGKGSCTKETGCDGEDLSADSDTHQHIYVQTKEQLIEAPTTEDEVSKTQTVNEPEFQEIKVEKIQNSDNIVTKTGKDKISNVFQMLKSITSSLLTSSNTEVNVEQTLQEKMKYYSLYNTTPRPESLSCKAQPFYMRYSILGEMFIDEHS